MITFQCPTSQSFRSQYDSIAHQIATFGFAVIGAWNSEAAALLEVARRFGRIQMHIRANADGLTGISTASDNREWHNYRSEYAGVTSEEFLPHTDGSFIHGLVPREDGSYIQLLPPKMLMLQCIQSAGSGGGNILIDGHEVYGDLRRQNGRCLDILSTKGCVTYCRDDQIALDRAVFEELDGGTIMLRFRYDFAAFVADWALEAFHTLQRDYFANPKYQRKLALSAGQILAVDNARMLHGREAFSDDASHRKCCRVWLAHDRLPVLRNLANEQRNPRALWPYRAYDVLPAAAQYDAAAARPVGIQKAGLAPVMA